MIKDFKTFSKNVKSDIDKMDGYRSKIYKLKLQMDETYKEDIIEGVMLLLNVIKDKYKFDNLFNFLRDDIIKDSTDILEAIRELAIYVDDSSYAPENIRYINGNWYIDVYFRKYEEGTLIFSEIETESLFEIFEILLHGLSSELNSEAMKKLNESTVFFDIENTISKINDKRKEIKDTKKKLKRLNTETIELSKSINKYKEKMIFQIEDILINVVKEENTLEAYMRENDMEILYDEIFDDMVKVVHQEYPDHDIFNLTAENGYWAFDAEDGQGHVDSVIISDDLDTISVYKILKILATIPQVSKYINQSAMKKLNESKLEEVGTILNNKRELEVKLKDLQQDVNKIDQTLLNIKLDLMVKINNIFESLMSKYNLTPDKNGFIVIDKALKEKGVDILDEMGNIEFRFTDMGIIRSTTFNDTQTISNIVLETRDGVLTDIQISGNPNIHNYKRLENVDVGGLFNLYKYLLINIGGKYIKKMNEMNND